MASSPALRLPNPLPRNTPKPQPRTLPIPAAAASTNGSLITAGNPGLRVAYQGFPGAYSELAAHTACPSCSPLPCRSFSDAVSAVDRRLADRAILPVESTLDGTALRNYDLLLRHDLHVVQELSLFVHYCLLAFPGVRAADLRKVISHPMALAHCGRAVSRLGLTRQAVEDTAGAVAMLRSHQIRDTAAIASHRAAVLYGLDVLADGIQDESWNVTRFLVLSRSPADPSGDRRSPVKTSMVVAHRGGSVMVLLKVLSAFSSRGVNLTKLEVNEGPVMILDVRGRGSFRAFSHVLYVDFEGSVEDSKVGEAIDEIAGFSVFVRILGCYAADPKVYDLQ